jgi:hypothetical protein
MGKLFALAALATVALLSTGCGTPGAPQAPSLKLPEPVTDLTAVRAGDIVTLHWTMPKKTTDHLLIAKQIHGPVRVRVCRKVGASNDCQTAGETSFAAEAIGDFHDPLPAALISGAPRQLSYFVELKNKPGPAGRSAGLSNAAIVLAGAAPPAITGLAAEVRADGVALHWNPAATSASTAVRLHRTLLNPKPAGKSKESGPLKPEAESLQRDLLVEAPAGQGAPENAALDATAKFGETYQYIAQRVDRVSLDGKDLELAGENSAPIRVDVVDTFPPAVPRRLAAVYVPDEKTIDLSWEPDTEPDLAGYIVYRIQTGSATSPATEWKRVSGEQPLTGPAFRDSTVEAGHSYRYAVTAIDQTGHESKRSAEAEETVSNP